MADDKTEEPSQRRLEEARKKGQVPKSQELNTVVVLLVAFYGLKSYAVPMYGQFSEILKTGLDNIGKLSFAPPDVLAGCTVMLAKMALIVAPFMAMLFFAALAVNFLQVGLLLSAQSLTPNFGKLNPMSGLQRMFSKQSLVQLIKAIAEITIVLQSLRAVVLGKGLVIFQLERMEPIAALRTLAELTWDVASRIITVLFIIAFLDYMYQKWQHIQNLKMSKQEVKDEYKQQEGDPHVKGRIRSKMREMARKRQMSAVPQASVVVTNPLHVAVALKYDYEAMEAPRVVAKGKGFVADRIRELARAHDVPIIENRDVARALYDNCEPDEDIPANMYQAVAEIIAYLYQRDASRYASVLGQIPGALAPVSSEGAAPAPTLGGLSGAMDFAAGQAARDVLRERSSGGPPPGGPE